MPPESPETFYAARLVHFRQEQEALASRAALISRARVALFVIPFGLVVAMVWGPVPSLGWYGVGACVVAFVALVFVHVSVFEKRSRADAAVAFYEKGQKRLSGEWRGFPSRGDDAAAAEHPYADDLDIVGPGSLLQLMDVTSTRFGEHALEKVLLEPSATPDDVGRERQAAVRELASLTTFRERLAVLGAVAEGDKNDPEPFVAWVEAPSELPSLGALRVASFALPLASLSLFVASRFGLVPSAAWLGTVIFSYLLSMWLGVRLESTFKATDRDRGLLSYAELFALVEATDFQAPSSKAAKESLRTEGRSASAQMAKLTRIVSFASARNNEVFRFFIGPMVLWDVHCALALEAFRTSMRGRLRPWFVALGSLDALASVGTFAYEHPEFAWPAFDDGRATLKFKGLGHPLLEKQRRVTNDLDVDGALIVTGSNMSGKSTLLRSLGINVVLAYAGAPVCAEAMSLGNLRVVTSMRVRDSVGDGVSRFYAELRKLRVVLDAARDESGPKALFLLDEILHGTNARERLIGARAFVRELLRAGAIGAVSTHDLELGLVEAEAGTQGRVRNVHFEEQVENDIMTFDYKLREGVVQSSNALRLMKLVGIDVV